MLTEWGNGPKIVDNALFEEDDDTSDAVTKTTAMKDLTPAERSSLARCLKALENNQERDPKYQRVLECLVQNEWLERGCIIFSQYFDSIWWLANQLSSEMSDESIGIYAGGGKSGMMIAGQYQKVPRDTIKQKVGKVKAKYAFF